MPNRNRNRRNRLLKRQVAREVKKDVKKIVAQQKPKKKGPTAVGRFIRMAGGVAGGLFGQPKLGRQLGAGISRVFGQGDYTITNAGAGGEIPSFKSPMAGERVTDKEFLTEITSSTDFQTLLFKLNPGDASTFPKLSKKAALYEEYQFNGLIFTLQSSSGELVGSTSPALGTWGALTQYDPVNVPFNSLSQALNYAGVAANKPSCTVYHGVECDKNQNVMKRLYVRHAPLLNGEDVRFYDPGFTQIFTHGALNPGVIGKLYVSYDVTFTKSRTVSAVESSVGAFLSGTGCTASAIVGTTRTLDSRSSLLLESSPDSITLPQGSGPGTYLVTLYTTNSLTMNMATLTVTFSGSVVNNPTLGSFSAPQNGLSGTTATSKTLCIYKNSFSPGTITFGSMAQAPSLFNVFVTALPSSFNPSTSTLALANKEVDEIRDLLKAIKTHGIQRVVDFLEKESDVVATLTKEPSQGSIDIIHA